MKTPRLPGQIPPAARERFLELVDRMGWTFEDAIKELYANVGKRQKIGKKAVEHWLSPKRSGIPFKQIFLISDFLDVDGSWLSGQEGLSLEEAVRPGGFCALEIGRAKRAVERAEAAVAAKTAKPGRRKPA